jgi:glycosyltransferase involved in cell wall biosynthesis
MRSSKGNKESVRVLHVNTQKSWRGGERQVFLLMKNLSILGVEQMLLCPNHSILADRAKNIPGLIIAKSSKKRGGVDFRFARKLSQCVAQHKMNVIHAHDAHAHTASVLATTFFRNKAKIIVSRRVVFPIGKSWFTRFKYNHRIIGKIICVSKAISQIVEKSIHNKNIEIAVVHSGIDLSNYPEEGIDLFEEFSIPRGRTLIANAGALEINKDYFTFLDTIRLLNEKEQNVQGLIFGVGGMKDELERYTEEMKMEDFVIFAGFKDNIHAYLKGADIFLFTSKMEGLGTAVLDAFALKVPVVATDAGGISEMVRNEETGLLCAIGDANCLALGVQRIIENVQLRNALVEGAQTKLLDFTSDKTAKQTLNHYHDLIKQIN